MITEIEAILARAQQYQHEVYQRTGTLPRRWLVTAEEYHIITQYFWRYILPKGTKSVECLLFHGMEIVGPASCGREADSDTSPFDEWAQTVDRLCVDVKKCRRDASDRYGGRNG
jgi:hypothetical protein